MKKIISLVLATAMLSTTAFAGTAIIPGNGMSSVNPGTTMTLKAGDFNTTKNNALVQLSLTNAGEFNSGNFTVSYKKFSKGANLVKSVAFNDDDSLLEIKLVSDYTLSKPASDNLIIERIDIKSKKDIKVNDDGKLVTEVAKNTTYQLDSALRRGLTVGYTMTSVALGNGGKIEYSADGVVKFEDEKSGGAVTAKCEAYGDVSGSGGDMYITGRAYKGDKIFTKFSSSIGDDQKAILKEYPEADLRFTSFTTSGLSSNHTVEITADEDEFIYEIADGKLVKSNLKWDTDVYAWSGKIRTSKNYVISDVELKAVTGTTDTAPTNPETGANDVVGVAAALAVVSLVAAGAVSLKK